MDGIRHGWHFACHRLDSPYFSRRDCSSAGQPRVCLRSASAFHRSPLCPGLQHSPCLRPAPASRDAAASFAASVPSAAGRTQDEPCSAYCRGNVAALRCEWWTALPRVRWPIDWPASAPPARSRSSCGHSLTARRWPEPLCRYAYRTGPHRPSKAHDRCGDCEGCSGSSTAYRYAAA